MKIGNVIASLGITTALVCVGSVLTGIGTRNRIEKRKALANRLFHQNQIPCDVVQLRKSVVDFNKHFIYNENLTKLK